MPDIRNFFGGRGGQGVGSSQEKPAAKETVSPAIELHKFLVFLETIKIIPSPSAKGDKDKDQRCVTMRSNPFKCLLYVGKRKVLSDSEDDAEEQRYGTLAIF